MDFINYLLLQDGHFKINPKQTRINFIYFESALGPRHTQYFCAQY